MPLRPIRPKAKRVGRPRGPYFIQARRLDRLRELLETRTEGVSLVDLARELYLSTRSVRRYLRELGQETELESHPVCPGGENLWRIKPSERGRAVPLRRTQAYALLAARRVFEVLRGSALFDEIDVALRSIEQVAHRPVTRAPLRGEVAGDARLEERFVYVPRAARAYAHRAEDVDELFQAVADARVLRFRNAADGKTARVTAHPYALVLHDGFVTCLARDVDRGATRAFRLDDMSELAASESERFELPPEIDLAAWLQGDFGVARAGRGVRVVVEFDARVAEAVRARRVHPSQKVAVAPDGRVRVSMSVAEAPRVMAEVRRWVLGFGASARVVEPQALAREIASELARAADRYTSG